MSPQSVVLLSTTAEPSAAELSLQHRLRIPLCSQAKAEAQAEAAEQQTDSPRSRFYLRLLPDGLTLYQDARDDRYGLRVDLTAPALQRRAREPLKRQGLGRAIGLKKTSLPSVLDATAGLGTDTFLMAYHGCELVALERNPVVHALLDDGLVRAAGSGLAPVVARINLRLGDFNDCDWSPRSVDVVYLDPMFPASGKSARVKKPMAVLQALLGSDSDPAPLLERALEVARKRVVVKRGRLSPVLPGRAPDVSLRGRSNRYDIYLQT